MDTDIIDQIKEYMLTAVSQKRREHSIRTGLLAQKMCSIYGVDEFKGLLAGTAHDIAKNLSDKDMIEVSQRDGRDVSSAEKNNPSLLHGRASAVIMKERFGITDEEVLSAVANHTLGEEGLCDLAKIIFAADKIEPGRPQSTEEYRNRLLSMDINKMTLSVLQENFDYLEKKGIKPADSSVAFKKYLEEQIKTREL